MKNVSSVKLNRVFQSLVPQISLIALVAIFGCLAPDAGALDEQAPNESSEIQTPVVDTPVSPDGITATTVVNQVINADRTDKSKDFASSAALDETNPKTGAYIFTLPLNVPPGINGLAPKLSINYTSDGPQDSLFGTGFDMPILRDCIVREAPAAVTANSGLIYGHGLASFTDKDIFYLSGQRLVRCDTASAQADDPSIALESTTCPAGTYRSANNDFAKIVADKVNNKFTVYNVDGSTTEYARITQSYFAPPSASNFDKTLKYCVSKVTKDGNTVDIQDGPGANNLLSIYYGGQSAATHKWRIQVKVQDRPDDDWRDTIQDGVHQVLSSRVSGIEIHTWPSLNLVRRYALTYDSVLSWITNRSRLSTIQEFGSDNTTSNPPYIFTWQDSTVPSFGWTPASWQAGGSGLDSGAVFTKWVSSYGDINAYQRSTGTSITDTYHSGLPGIIRKDDANPVKVYRNNNHGSFSLDTAFSSKLASIPNLFAGVSLSQLNNSAYNVDQGIRFADVNGDGYPDVVQASYTTHLPEIPDSGSLAAGVWLWNPAASNGTGGFSSTLGESFAQSLRDNKISFTYVLDFAGEYNGPVQYGAGTQLLDVNNDGLPDIVIMRDGPDRQRREVYINNGSSFEPAPVGMYPLPTLYNDNTGTITDVYFAHNEAYRMPKDMGVRAGDFNGDGYIDFMQILQDETVPPAYSGHPIATIGAWINNGNGWEEQYWWEDSLKAPATNTGTNGFYTIMPFNYVTYGGSPGHFANHNLGITLADVNGDGNDDFVSGLCYDVISGNGTAQDCSHIYTYLTLPAYPYSLKFQKFNNYNLPTYLFYTPSQQCSLTPLDEASCDLVTVQKDSGLRLMDIDRDGTVDLFGSRLDNGTQLSYVATNKLLVSREKLIKVQNPLGGYSQITYMLADGTTGVESQSPNLQMPKVVVRSIYTDNGRLGTAANGRATRWRTFDYFGGQFDHSNREFTGFRAIRVQDNSPESGVVNYTTTWYKNDPSDRCHSGAPEFSVVSESSCTPGSSCTIGGSSTNWAPQLDATKIQSFGVHNVTENSYNACASDLRGPFFSPITDTRTWNYDPNKPTTPVSSRKQYYYDQFGNQIAAMDYKSAVDTEPYRASWAQYNSLPPNGSWITDRVCQRGEMSFDHPGRNANLYGAQYFYYDNNDGYPCNITGAGRLTRVENGDWTGINRDDSQHMFTSLRYSYTTAGNIASVTDALGHVTTTDWNSSLPEIVPKSKTDASGVTNYTYDAYANQQTASAPDGTKQQIRYDELQRAYQFWNEDKLGNHIGTKTITFWPGASGSNTSTQKQVTTVQIDSTHSVTRTSYYDGAGKIYLDQSSNSAGNHYYLLSFTFDGAGRPLKSTLPYQGTVVFSPTAAGTSVTYDALGREATRTVPGGYQTIQSYSVWQDGSGQVFNSKITSLDNIDGTTRQHQVLTDSLGRESAVAECTAAVCGDPTPDTPGMYITTFGYDGLDNRTDITLSDGVAGHPASRVKNFFDAYHRVIATKDPDTSNCVDSNIDDIHVGCPRIRKYDDLGNLVAETDPAFKVASSTGSSTQYTYDNLNRLKTKAVTKGALTTSTTYTYDTDECGSNGAYLTRISRVVYSDSANGEQNTTKICYDASGRTSSRTISVTTPNGQTPVDQRTSFSYRDDGQLATETMPDNEVLTFGYDDLGQPTTLTSSSIGQIVTSSTYTAQGKRATMTYGNGAQFDYSYRTGLSDGAGCLGIYCRSDFRLGLINASVPNTSFLWAKYFDYDAIGNIVVLSDMDFVSPDYEEFFYDKLDRLTEYRLDGYPSQSFTYDSLANQLSRTTLTQFQFDAIKAAVAARRPALKSSGFVSIPRPKISQSGRAKKLAKSKNKHLIVRSSPHSRARIRAIRKLTKRQKAAALKAGTINNPAVLSPGTVGGTVEYMSYGSSYSGQGGPHALKCAGLAEYDPCTTAVRNYEYDSNGNATRLVDLSHGVTTDYTFDFEGRLRTVVNTQGVNIRNYYAPDGNKIADWDAGTFTLYLNDVYQLRNGAAVRYYLFDGQKVAYREGSSAASYYITDHLGSVRQVLSGSAGIVATRDYLPFGDHLFDVNTMPGKADFNGKLMSSDRSLNYGARVYSPDQARFNQPDSVVPNANNPQAYNHYSYVFNRPVNLVDPSGHWPQISAESLSNFFSGAGNLINSTIIQPALEATQTFFEKFNPEFTPGLRDAVAASSHMVATTQGPIAGAIAAGAIPTGPLDLAAVAFDIANTPVSPGPDATLLTGGARAFSILENRAGGIASEALSVLPTGEKGLMASTLGTAERRIADFSSESAGRIYLGETKDVTRLYNTAQMRDYWAYLDANPNARMVLEVAPRTRLSGPLSSEIARFGNRVAVHRNFSFIGR